MSKIYKTFDDLVFKDHELAKAAKELVKRIKAKKLIGKPSLLEMINSQIDSKQAIIEFDNKRSLSVVLGDCFYSNGINTYECMESYTSEPEGYMTAGQVTRLMKEIQDKPEYSDEEY